MTVLASEMIDVKRARMFSIGAGEPMSCHTPLPVWSWPSWGGVSGAQVSTGTTPPS